MRPKRNKPREAERKTVAHGEEEVSTGEARASRVE